MPKKSVASTPVTGSLNLTVKSMVDALVGFVEARVIEATVGGVASNPKLAREASSAGVRNAAACPAKPPDMTRALAAAMAPARVLFRMEKFANRAVWPAPTVKL